MTFIATPNRPVTVYYCKANVKTGLTVRVVVPWRSGFMSQPGEFLDCRGVRLIGVDSEMIHGNSTGKPKASGHEQAEAAALDWECRSPSTQEEAP